MLEFSKRSKNLENAKSNAFYRYTFNEILDK